jgi:hypothetical protein
MTLGILKSGRQSSRRGKPYGGTFFHIFPVFELLCSTASNEILGTISLFQRHVQTGKTSRPPFGKGSTTRLQCILKIQN